MNGLREVKVIAPSKAERLAEKVRVGAYCRVSSDSDDQLNSFFAQVKYYNDYIRYNPKMYLVDIYADEGISGMLIQKREEFKRMLKDAQAGKLDRILVKSVTRFARNSLECIESVRKLKSYGVSVYFENDNIDTEHMNSEMILYIKSAFAQGEALSAAKRMVTSVRMRMENGTYNLASAPYGYRLGKDGLILEPKEAENVKKIYELYLQGISIRKICEIMEPKDTLYRWTPGNIRYILMNERYIGDCLIQKKFTPTIIPLRQKPNRGELPKYYYSNTHEAIISKEDFNAAQELREEREKKHYKETKGKIYFFTGKVKCRTCGWAFKRIEKATAPVWVCSKKGRAVEACHTPQHSDEDFRQAFIRMFNRLKQNENTIVHETILQLQTLKSKINNTNSKIDEIDTELVSLAEKNRIYNELYVKQMIDEITYLEQTDIIKSKTTELRGQRFQLLNEDDEERSIEGLRHLQRILKNQEYLMEMNEEVFTQIVKVIYVEPNGDLTFQLKCGLELRMKGRE